jgi:hypothetical protein
MAGESRRDRALQGHRLRRGEFFDDLVGGAPPDDDPARLLRLLLQDHVDGVHERGGPEGNLSGGMLGRIRCPACREVDGRDLDDFSRTLLAEWRESPR